MLLNLIMIVLFSTSLFISAILTYTGLKNKRFSPQAFIAYLATLVFGSIMFSGITVVDQTEQGIVLRGGKIVREASSGYNFTIPFVENVVKVSTQSETTRFEAITAYTSDQQRAQIFVSLTYRVPSDKVDELYTNFKNVDNLMDRVIRRNITSIMGETLGSYKAEDTVKDRAGLSKAYSDKILDKLKKYPIEIIGVQVENVTFSQEYNNMIEDNMKSEVKIKTANSELEIVKVDAQKKERMAEAEAYAVIKAGEAEALKIKTVNDALSNSPSYLRYLQIITWDGAYPQTVVGSDSQTIMNLPPNK